MLYGLIGYPLSHSFSQRYFTEKFANNGYFYKNFPLAHISELHNLLAQEVDLQGFNVTIPYKEQILPFLDEMDAISTKTGAVNTVKVVRTGTKIRLKGYNTDVYGFSRSLEEWFASQKDDLPDRALVLGTGGAAKAVICALSDCGISTGVVSRKEGKHIYKTYNSLTADDIETHNLIINTTPLGMYPDIARCPDIPYSYLTQKHYLYDLVYNPPETMFMNKGLENGAQVRNGERMLHLQANRAWEIWGIF